MLRYFNVLFLLLIIAGNSYGQDLILNTPLQTRCSKESFMFHDSISNYYYGVAGTGFIGRDEYIGKDCIAKKQWAGPWKPVDGYKRTLCGYLSIKKRRNPFKSPDKEKYHLISDGDGDMVIYVIPDPAFRWLQFNSLRPQGHMHKDYALACEVALKEPGKSAETNAAEFIKSLNLDSIQFKPVGVYGPWVSDVPNENSPEIHPVQQMWRREVHGDSIVEYQLYSFFDNSSRYDEKKDFTGTCEY